MTPDLDANTKSLTLKTSRYHTYLLISIGGSVIMSAILVVLLNLQIKKYQTLKVEIQGIHDTQIAAQNLQSLAQNKINDLSVITNVFPDDTNIVLLIQELEQIIHQYDPDGLVRFTPQGPAKYNNQLSVTLVMTMTATPTELINFLRSLERLPHILEIKKLDLKTPEGLSNPSQITATVILYVQDPFSQPD